MRWGGRCDEADNNGNTPGMHLREGVGRLLIKMSYTTYSLPLRKEGGLFADMVLYKFGWVAENCVIELHLQNVLQDCFCIYLVICNGCHNISFFPA